MSITAKQTDQHAADIAYQFTAQAAVFAAAPELRTEAALMALVTAAESGPNDTSLNVACGPGTVACAFARHVKEAAGFDATPAMLDQARALAARENLTNVAWHHGEAEALPFPEASFDIVTCRFAMRHVLCPARVFAEMVRVCKPGGRVVVCDGMAPDDPGEGRRLQCHGAFP